ncbi:hypothetical protein [Polaromonas naphthalenivorans]|nr:hypothetical protein [Polaromonas naphthalenivorans]
MSASTKTIAALVGVLALLLSILGFGYGPWATHQQAIGEQRATTAYNLAIDRQKREAGELLAIEAAKANAATTALADFKTEREKHDVENKSAIATLAARLRTAAGPAGRLRDPNAAAGCGGGGAGAPGADPARVSSGADDAAQAGGLFSAGATELFQRLTREADDINVAYASCRTDSLTVREVLK